MSCPVNPVAEEAEASIEENFNNLSPVHSLSIFTGHQVLQKGEIFASLQQDVLSLLRPETSSSQAAKVMIRDEGRRVSSPPGLKKSFWSGAR